MTLKLTYFGHKTGLLTIQIVGGMIEGKRKRGGQKKNNGFDNIKEWTGLRYMMAKRSVQNRSGWKRIIKKSVECGRQSSGMTAAAR